MFPPSVRWVEVVVSVFLTFLYGFLLTAYVHAYREPEIGMLVIPLVIALLTGYSLFST